MGAKSFLMCDVTRFNKRDYMIPIQKDLFEQNEDFEGESEITIKLINRDYHMEFDQYRCHHDFVHNKSGRVFNKSFTHYFEPIDFYTYYNENINLAFIQAKTEISLDFIHKLNLTKNYEMGPVNIDFRKMIPHITEVAGAWIADLKRAHLKTAGFFGPNVHKSEEYIEAASEGDVSSIQMKYISQKTKEEHFVTISKKGSIVLYETFPTIEEEIDIVYEIYDKFINPHV
ncbi:hypothetical protein RVS70_09250 [Virgibacillus sp. M23]|uniref:hypothetical protein n=1 Tax=Virgibacillus sp. M23 TaxID=3079030 RepID=UPI002A917270|nr:hypothetical protein [Virgibacillus sp. M23]MDY7044390.1 hypothetical protein [Virgibacillus sp. M23]